MKTDHQYQKKIWSKIFPFFSDQLFVTLLAAAASAGLIRTDNVLLGAAPAGVIRTDGWLGGVSDQVLVGGISGGLVQSGLAYSAGPAVASVAYAAAPAVSIAAEPVVVAAKQDVSQKFNTAQIFIDLILTTVFFYKLKARL